MPCPFRALFTVLERGLSIGLLLAAGMSDLEDDPLASPIGIGAAREHNRPQRALTA